MIARLKTGIEWLKSTYLSERFYEIAKTACGEIAVLLFVFPLIDMLGKNEAAKHDWGLPIGSVAVGIFFLAMAGVFANKEKDEREKEVK